MSASSASNSIAEGTTPVAPTLSLLDDTADDGASKMYLEEATHAQIAQDAFLGFAFTSLSDAGPVKLDFHSVNKHCVLMSKVHSLVRSFRSAGVKNWRNPVPMIIPAGYVNLNTITRAHIESAQGPTLEWLPAAHGQTVECLDGRHRREALRLRVQGLETRRNEETIPERIEDLQTRLDDIDTLRADQMRWLMGLYDKGKSQFHVFVFVRAEDAWLSIHTDIVGDNEAVKNLLSVETDTAWFRQLR